MAGRGAGFGLSWARLARTSCSSCASTALRWGTIATLLWDAQGLEHRARLVHLAAWFGPDAEAWLCTVCGEWGVFSADIVL